MADPIDPNTDFVYIRLGAGDNSAAPARVTRTAYELVHKAKGFVLVDDDEAALALSPDADLAATESTKKKG
jgi:hypothetical protein